MSWQLFWRGLQRGYVMIPGGYNGIGIPISWVLTALLLLVFAGAILVWLVSHSRSKKLST